MKNLSAFTTLLLFCAAFFLTACSLDSKKNEIKPITAVTSPVVSNAQSPLPAKKLILRSGEGLTTSKIIQTDCQIIFINKCYGGKDFDLTNFVNEEQVDNFCNQSGNITCSSQECSDRLKILLGLGTIKPGKEHGPGQCLPAKHM